MEEWFQIIRDISLISTGAILTFIVTYFMDKLQIKRKKKEIARLIIADLNAQIGKLTSFKDFSEGWLEMTDDKELIDEINDSIVYFDFYNTFTFQSLLEKLPILPNKCLSEIIEYYSKAKTYDKIFRKRLKTGDIAIISEVLNHAYYVKKLAYKTMRLLYDLVLHNKKGANDALQKINELDDLLTKISK